ncbi:MAG: methyltransferase domain-containing protein, partial [Candidatus Dadabacteria bacterium]|nr:methyltransferase domain-containing protein [Candidatus Dadabacteria bacterium]
VEDAYQKNAKTYDLALKLFYPIIGLRINEYRKKAVDYLNLNNGDLVVDLGCGTGLGFSLLKEKIGPNGRLIGIDVSTEMLSIAENRVKSAGWKNVELIHSDIEEYEFPANINGLISTGVFGYIEDRTKILDKIYKSLADNGKVVIVDGKQPQKWPPFLFKVFVKLSSPYGLTESYFDNNTPEIVSRLFQNVTIEDMYGGL